MKGKDMEKGLREVKAAKPKAAAGRRSEYKPITFEEFQEKERERNRRRHERDRAKRGLAPASIPAPAKPAEAPDPFEVSPERRAYLRSLPPLSPAERAARIAEIARRAAGEG